jgi:Kef-type K+ transport system membrane component KefB
MTLTGQIAVLLAATVIAVPLFRRFKLSAVLGYLAAGVVIGPWGLGLFHDVENILNFAEFGVVLLLFVIGLELQPSRLWVMRHAIFGAGGVQVAVTTAALAAATLALDVAGERRKSSLIMQKRKAPSRGPFISHPHPRRARPHPQAGEVRPWGQPPAGTVPTAAAPAAMPRC